MSQPLETITKHTDGTQWVACTAASPKTARQWTSPEGVVAAVYHPDAKDTDGGGDAHYECPHCGSSWWVEHD